MLMIWGNPHGGYRHLLLLLLGLVERGVAMAFVCGVYNKFVGVHECAGVGNGEPGVCVCMDGYCMVRYTGRRLGLGQAS